MRNFYPWVAGFLEADGHLSFVGDRVVIGIAQNTRPILEHIKHETGMGNVYEHDGQYQWQITAREDCREFLSKVGRYMRMKGEKAREVYEHLESKQ